MLLQPQPEFAPPLDFLLARVRYRRALIDVTGGQDPWPGQSSEEGLQRALQWLFQRLPVASYRQLQPYFELLSGRSLVMALRLHRAETEDALRRLLQQSLLQRDIRDLFLQTEAPDKLVLRLEAALAPEYPELRGLMAIYTDQGPGGVEEQIAAGLLRRARLKARTAALQALVARLVDLRNILSVGKYWRWQVAQEPPLAKGGRVAPERLRRLWSVRDEAGLAQLVVRLARQPGPLPQDARDMELCLLRGVTAEMRRFGKDPLGPGFLLDYLWRCQVAARNRALTSRQAARLEPFFDELKVTA